MSRVQEDDERTPLLAEPTEHENVVREGSSEAGSHDGTPGEEIPADLSVRLYVSHFLSTWNSRVFEFGAVLYLATIFPGTLLPMSIYALIRGASAIVFSPAIGQYIDTADRLQVVRLSIGSYSNQVHNALRSSLNVPTVLQRLVVAASCVIFYLLAIGLPAAHGLKTGALVLLAILACVEKLCAIMNLVSIERDWVGPPTHLSSNLTEPSWQVVVVAEKNEAGLRGMSNHVGLHLQEPVQQISHGC